MERGVLYILIIIRGKSRGGLRDCGNIQIPSVLRII
jgi:hypothetical protein